MSLFFYSFTFAISLWHRKFVTADVTGVSVNNQHGIQRRGQDFDKNTYTHSIHSYTRRKLKISALRMQFVCIFTYLLNICGKFEFLISQGSVAICLR